MIAVADAVVAETVGRARTRPVIATGPMIATAITFATQHGAGQAASSPRYDPQSYIWDYKGHKGPNGSGITLMTCRRQLGADAHGSHKGIVAAEIRLWRISRDPSPLLAGATLPARATVPPGATLPACATVPPGARATLPADATIPAT